MGIFERLHAPSFDGATGWLNSDQDEVRERTVEITFDAAGAEGYSFTFG